jgi:DNA-binding XRE family transcriptional regulator
MPSTKRSEKCIKCLPPIQIWHLREKASICQQELANSAELFKITIQRFENAKYSVTLDTLISISDALQIPLKKLVDY